ncbi:MAG: RNA polymerase sigma factor FliA [Pseudomonadota bacterium]|nr:RNA polymerase sigma factor FliA [Pseudomonadota bacterium]
MLAAPTRAYGATAKLDSETRIKEFAPLVRRMAHHMAAKLPPSVEIDDIIQAGMIGLMDAASRYQEGQGAQFETFATQRIRGAMLDELRSNDWLPRSARKSMRRIEAAVHKLQQRLGRAATEKEIAAELGETLESYQSLLQEARGCELLHLEDFGRSDDDDYLDRHCPDKGNNPLDLFQDARFRGALVKAIEALPEREKLLMGLYYEQDLNFKEIAAVLEVSESRVCQLHSQAVARLRARLRDW